MEFVRQALLPVLMSCAASSGNVETLEELVNQVELFYKDYAAASFPPSGRRRWRVSRTTSLTLNIGYRLLTLIVFFIPFGSI